MGSEHDSQHAHRRSRHSSSRSHEGSSAGSGHDGQRSSRSNRSGRSGPGSRETSSHRSVWLSAFDGFLLLALAVPFVLGGKLAWGELLVIVSAVGCSVCWSLHQLTRSEPTCVWTKAELALLAIVSIGLLQTVPLSPALVATISPKISEILPLWDGSESSLFDRWSFLSLAVRETRQALVLGVAYVLLFWLTAQRIRNLRDAQRLLKSVCVSAAVMAGFGLIQFLASNGKFYWFFEFPAGTTADRVKGAFPNKNHFAAYLTLALGPCIWWMMELADQSIEDEEIVFGVNKAAPLPKSIRMGLVAGAGALIAVGLLSSMSRGAFVSGGIGVTVMLLILYVRGMVSKRLIAGLMALAIAAASLQLVVGYEKMVNRLNRWDDNGRLPIWKANIAVISDFPILGSGIGSHRSIHLRYIDRPYEETEYTHAESNYLQVASETGLVGLSLALLSLAVCFYWCVKTAKVSRDPRIVVAQLALLSSLIATTIGSLFDFTWYIPGYMVILVLEMACACRLYQLAIAEADTTKQYAVVVPRLTLITGLLLVVGVGGWMVQVQWPAVAAEPHWLRYRRLVFDAEQEQQIAAEEAEEQSDDGQAKKLDLLTLKLQALRAAAKANPHDSRIQLRLMRHYVLVFHELQRDGENAMPLSQIRDAAIASEFQNRDELRSWLKQAIGEPIKFADAAYKHGLRSLKTNPLLFHSYLDLAELAFLGGAPEEFHQRSIDQALVLAPNEAQVLFVAGREAFLKQDVETACKHWKRAFHRNRGVQFEILRIIVGVPLPPGTSQVDFIVQLFDPDIEALDKLAFIQHAMQKEEESRRTVELLATRLEARAESEDNLSRSKDWLKVAAAFARLEQNDQVERCFLKAVASSQSSYFVHLEYGLWLYQQRRGVDARDQLTWCITANPRDARVAKILDRLSRGIYPEPIQQAATPTDPVQQTSAEQPAANLPTSTRQAAAPGLDTARQ